jgi:hypothetical protein
MHQLQRASFNDSSREWSETQIDLEIQLLRLVQLALAGAVKKTNRPRVYCSKKCSSAGTAVPAVNRRRNRNAIKRFVAPKTL